MANKIRNAIIEVGRTEVSGEFDAQDTFYLYWDKGVLRVDELEKSKQTVESYREGVRAGDEFPSVPVYRVGDNEYALTHTTDAEGIRVGGHNRAKAHHLEGAPLKCYLNQDLRGEEGVDFSRAPTIGDIVLVDDIADLAWRTQYYGGKS